MVHRWPWPRGPTKGHNWTAGFCQEEESKILGERNLPSTLLSGNFSTYGSLGDRRTLFVHYKDKKGSLSLTALTPRVGVSYLLQAWHTEILGTDGHVAICHDMTKQKGHPAFGKFKKQYGFLKCRIILACEGPGGMITMDFL